MKKKDIKFTQLLSLGVVISGLVAGAFLVQQPQNLSSKAADYLLPTPIPATCKCTGAAKCKNITNISKCTASKCTWSCPQPVPPSPTPRPPTPTPVLGCSPSCSTGWFCSTFGGVNECCKCNYGSATLSSTGPITCCTPGGTSCHSNNISGCKPPPTPTPQPPTPAPSCSSSSCPSPSFCSNNSCCTCIYGFGTVGQSGPITCCAPGNTSCQTYNVSGCRPAP